MAVGVDPSWNALPLVILAPHKVNAFHWPRLPRGPADRNPLRVMGSERIVIHIIPCGQVGRRGVPPCPELKEEVLKPSLMDLSLIHI